MRRLPKESEGQDEIKRRALPRHRRTKGGIPRGLPQSMSEDYEELEADDEGADEGGNDEETEE
jgi:hypothetical protein